MIEIIRGSFEEQIINLLQKKYPMTTFKLASKLPISRKKVEWILRKMQIKGILRLELLPGKIYVRLLRKDFLFIGTAHQKKYFKQRNKDKEESNESRIDTMYL